MRHWVHRFGESEELADGRFDARSLLGGKGANLAEMSRLGLPVPPGFTVITDACRSYHDADGKLPESAWSQISDALKHIESSVGRRFGGPGEPLLVSVRSGAAASMPGMMDTVLNLGLNDETVLGLAHASNDARFAWDSYRRFIEMYSDIVLGLQISEFEFILDEIKDEQAVLEDSELSADALKATVSRYRDLVAQQLGEPFPQDPVLQLHKAVNAVLESWNNRRAREYRRIHRIPDWPGTAVNIQAMVFGNMGENCATGVAFTRNPDTGENAFFGEYLVNAQGEDVVAGMRTPEPIHSSGNGTSLQEVLPDAYRQLEEICATLEEHFQDIQDVEFTVEKGRLFMLQTRTAKRSIQAALKIAVDMAHEGRISRNEALCRIDPVDLDRLLHPVPDPRAPRDVVARGLPGSPGAASGKVVFHADDAQMMSADGHAVILVRPETSPEDIHGMHAATGILTRHGGQTSHAALVARGMGRPCVTGAGTIRVDTEKEFFSAGDRVFHRGDTITIDGSTGDVIAGEIPTVESDLSDEFRTLLQWADDVRQLRVRANAETAADALKAREMGAEGIGLCRTEHMFFEDGRIAAMREMIMAEDADGRIAPLTRILPMQRDDFVELFRIMAGMPVTVRLLDPPLHEFLPVSNRELEDLARHMDADLEQIRIRAGSLRELNPMLGHRGCRVGISHPEIYEMQIRALLQAAVQAEIAAGEPVHLEIMVPLVFSQTELSRIRTRIDLIADGVRQEFGDVPAFLVGTMIELPRAALRGGEIAACADFFSFGTNDLTQTTFGISRDDSSRFLESYQSEGILDSDPFVSIDRDGVGELMEIAVARGRKVHADLKLGICGEHGGDPDSIAFCHGIGLDYVSCSPYRVPIARLAAAQAAIRYPRSSQSQGSDCP